jgi:ferritin-like metal-binding protein YciE
LTIRHNFFYSLKKTFMEKMNDLKDLLRHEIEDLYSAEEQIIEALPLMIENANNQTLKNSLNEHLEVTKAQKKRLDQVLKLMGPNENKNKKGFLSGLFGGKHECKAMKGIIEEGNKIMAEDMSPEVMDAAIIASAQKVEHYEICGYGTARSFARELGLTKVQDLLQETLDEEYEADNLLTVLAESSINQEAESTEDSASGSSRRKNSGERVSRTEKQMEPVANRRTSISGRSSSGNGKSSGPGKSNGNTGRGTRSTGGRGSSGSSRGR